jgi:putative PIN family toxin of toxin-antitoxin system
VITAVLDTNVLASGFAGYDKAASPPGELVRRWRRGAFVLIVSEHILGEFAHTLTDRYFTNRLTPEQIAAIFARLRRDAMDLPITADVSGVATQPKDDLVLATAVSGEADFLVTGDKPLQALGAYRQVTIISPRLFLDLLDLQSR